MQSFAVLLLFRDCFAAVRLTLSTKRVPVLTRSMELITKKRPLVHCVPFRSPCSIPSHVSSTKVARSLHDVYSRLFLYRFQPISMGIFYCTILSALTLFIFTIPISNCRCNRRGMIDEYLVILSESHEMRKARTAERV